MTVFKPTRSRGLWSRMYLSDNDNYHCQGCNEPHDIGHLSIVTRDEVSAMLCAVCVIRVVFDLPSEAAVRLSEATKGP